MDASMAKAAKMSEEAGRGRPIGYALEELQRSRFEIEAAVTDLMTVVSPVLTQLDELSAPSGEMAEDRNLDSEVLRALHGEISANRGLVKRIHSIIERVQL